VNHIPGSASHDFLVTYLVVNMSHRVIKAASLDQNMNLVGLPFELATGYFRRTSRHFVIPDYDRRLLLLKEIPWGVLDPGRGIGGTVIHWAVPKDITLGTTQVPDDQKSSFCLLSNITMTHEDTINPYTVTYSILPGAFASLYQISGNWIEYVGAHWDNTKWNPVIEIRVVDNYGGTFTKSFTLGFARVPKPMSLSFIESTTHPDSQTPDP
jgi:hypothetical protein